MRLIPQRLRVARRDAGFTLLETVVAAGLLLATIAAVTFTIVSVSRGGARLQQAMDGDRAVRRVAQRLSALRFCSVSYPQDAAAGAEPGRDLVAAVFPHADPAKNTETARYVTAAGDEGEPAGSFVTLFDEEGVQVRCVARFLAGPDGPALAPGALTGWDARTAAAPPGATLSVLLDVASDSRATKLVRSALTRAPIVPQPAVSAG